MLFTQELEEEQMEAGLDFSLQKEGCNYNLDEYQNAGEFSFCKQIYIQIQSAGFVSETQFLYT